MDIDLWYDSVSTAAIDLDAPGAEDRIVPIITNILLTNKSFLNQWYDELTVETQSVLVDGLAAISQAFNNQRHDDADFYSSICMASVLGQARTLVTQIVETNKESLLAQAIQRRNEIALSSHINDSHDEFSIPVKRRTA